MIYVVLCCSMLFYYVYSVVMQFINLNVFVVFLGSTSLLLDLCVLNEA